MKTRKFSSFSAAAAAGRSLACGFTLIEMLVVVALAAIVAALALPSFTGTLQRYRVSMAATQITNALQVARADAIRSRKNVAVISTKTPDQGCVQDGTGLDWHCGIDIYEYQLASNGSVLAGTPLSALKTVPATSFSTVSVKLASGTGSSSPNVQLVYTPLGFLSNCSTSTGACTASMYQAAGVNSLIYIWPTVLGADPGATVPVISTVCATMAGKIKIIPSYVAPDDASGKCST